MSAKRTETLTPTIFRDTLLPELLSRILRIRDL